MVIVPAFNDLCGGLPLNEPREDERGPILTLGEMDDARIFLLDGTNLGKLRHIRLAGKGEKRLLS
jgi:metallophosphoesterase superfamily enzyme